MSYLVDMSSDSTPSTSNTASPKVVAAGVAGSITVVLVFVASQCGLNVPPEVASAVTTILSFAAGFIKSS